MDIPQIPTDNLYKFLALFGIVIIAVFLILPPYFDHQIQLKAIQAQAEANVVQEKIDNVHHLKMAKAPELDYVEETRQIGDLLVEKVQVEGRKKETEFLLQQSERIMRAAKNGIFIGIAVSILGFLLWYFNLQRWQDAIQKKNARNQ